MSEKEEKPDERFLPSSLNDWNYIKSNKLINAKGKASLMSRRLFAISLMHIQEDSNGNAYSEIDVKEIIDVLGMKSSRSIYQQVKNATYSSKDSQSLMDWNIIYENEQDEQFRASHVVQSADYNKGKLRILYNSDLSKYILRLQKNYTVLNLDEELRMSSTNSLVLYEVLKSQLGYLRSIKHDKGPVEWGVYLTDLKFRLGLIASDDSQIVQNALLEKKVNYDELDAYLLEKGMMPYPNYHTFKQSVLVKAIREINKKTSLEVSFKEEKSGHGGKVKNIVFSINEKEAYTEPAEDDEEEIEIKTDKTKNTKNTDYSDSLLEITIVLAGSGLTVKDIKAVAESASYDVDRVKIALKLSEGQGNIKNLAGWLIKAVKEGYEPVVVKKKRSSGRKVHETNEKGVELGYMDPEESGFNNFRERVYDYGELEKKLRKN